jgi:lysozyme family protein
VTNDDIIERVLGYEGGFVDHPLDRGGPTKFGVTAAELGVARGLDRAATVAEVKALTRAEAKAVYAARYIAGPRLDAIGEPSLRLIVVDSAVLHGVGRAVRWLQQALGAPQDGAIGAATLAALAKADPGAIARKVLALRFAFIGALLDADPKEVVFAKGWISRVADLIQFA